MKTFLTLALTTLTMAVTAASEPGPATVTGWATWYSLESCKLDDKIRKVKPRTKFFTASRTPFSDSVVSCALPRDIAKKLNVKYGDNIRVTHLNTGNIITVKYLDRGPGQTSRSTGVIVDLSVAAMRTLAGETGIQAGRIQIQLVPARRGD